MDADVINNSDWSREAGYRRITVKCGTPTIFVLLQCMHGFDLSLSSSLVAPLLQVLINSLSIQGEKQPPIFVGLLSLCYDHAMRMPSLR